LAPNATSTPAVATARPASGARTVCTTTATVHIALLAVTTSSASTTSGINEDDAGLNAKDPSDKQNATA
jgi:hypothetical protein